MRARDRQHWLRSVHRSQPGGHAVLSPFRERGQAHRRARAEDKVFQGSRRTFETPHSSAAARLSAQPQLVHHRPIAVHFRDQAEIDKFGLQTVEHGAAGLEEFLLAEDAASAHASVHLLENLERVLGEREEQLKELNTYNDRLNTDYYEKVRLVVELIQLY